jgi:hypothetical protein
MVRITTLVLFAAALASHASLTAAQPADQAPPASEAVKLFEEGRDLAKAGKWEAACDKFSKSYELDRGVGTELNLADCQEHLGHVAEAWRLFDDAALQSKAQNNPTREKFARDRATGLEQKLGMVVVKLPRPDGATLTIAGKSVKPAPEVHERVDPGTVEVVVVTSDGKTYKKAQSARAGQSVTFNAADADVATSTIGEMHNPEVPPELPKGHRKKAFVYASLGLGAGGVVALGISGIVGLSARSDYNKYADDKTLCPQRSPLQCTDEGIKKVSSALDKTKTANYIAVAGAALLVAGAVVYFTAPRESGTEVVIAPTVSPDGIGIAAAGHF